MKYKRLVVMLSGCLIVIYLILNFIKALIPYKICISAPHNLVYVGFPGKLQSENYCHGIWQINLTKGTLRCIMLLPLRQQIWGMKASPDYHLLALSLGKELWVVSPRTGRVVKHWNLKRWFRLSAPVWSPDGRRIAICADSELLIFDIKTSIMHSWNLEPSIKEFIKQTPQLINCYNFILNRDLIWQRDKIKFIVTFLEINKTYNFICTLNINKFMLKCLDNDIIDYQSAKGNIAIITNQSIQVINILSKYRQEFIIPYIHGPIRWSPDGRFIACAKKDPSGIIEKLFGKKTYFHKIILVDTINNLVTIVPVIAWPYSFDWLFGQ